MCEYESFDDIGAMMDVLRNQKKNLTLMMSKMQLDIELRTKLNKWWKPGFLKEKKAIAEKAKLVKGVLIEGGDIIEGIDLAISSRVILSVMYEMNEKAISFENRYRHLALIHATLNR